MSESYNGNDGKWAIINSINISEELGQIEYILSDKTGTLTQNKMIGWAFLIREKEIPISNI